MIFITAISFIIFALSGCGYKSVEPGEDVSFFRGFLPAESWEDYKKRIEAEKNATENGKSSSGLRVKKEYIPGDGVKGSVSYGGKGVGIEVHDENNYRRDDTVIKLFGGSEGPDYNKARRNEKKNARGLEEQKLRQLAIDLAEQHAKEGYMSYAGVPGQYHEEYKRAYEYYENRSNQQDFNDYRNREYDRGVEDYRAENPEYGNFAQQAEQLERKARKDARNFRYDLPPDLSSELEKVYYDVFMTECIISIEEKARKDAKREIHDPPYALPGFMSFYEKTYKEELDHIRHKRGHRRR